MASLNSSLHKSLGDTPHFVVFGQDHRLPFSVLLEKEDPVYNFDDYVRLRTTDFQKIYKRVRDNISDSKQYMTAQQWKSASEKIILLADIVYIKVHEPKNKLAPRFEGPYRVIAYDTGNKLKIRHLTTLETKVTHVDNLKRTARQPYTDEETAVEVNSLTSDLPQAATPANADLNEYRKKLRSYQGDNTHVARGVAVPFFLSYSLSFSPLFLSPLPYHYFLFLTILLLYTCFTCFLLCTPLDHGWYFTSAASGPGVATRERTPRHPVPPVPSGGCPSSTGGPRLARGGCGGYTDSPTKSENAAASTTPFPLLPRADDHSAQQDGPRRQDQKRHYSLHHIINYCF